MSLIVFAIGVVGIVAIQARGIEAQRATAELREAERIAAEVMADLNARGFHQLVTRDFNNGLVAATSYSDAAPIIRDFRGVPVENTAAFQPGRRRAFYAVYRTVSAVPVGVPLGNAATVSAVNLDVTVLWLDYTNPAFPPPASATVSNLKLTDPVGTSYSGGSVVPWVGRVQLRTVRANDAGSSAVLGGP